MRSIYAVALMLTAIGGSYGVQRYRMRDLPFNVIHWKTERHLRPRMVDDLIAKHLTPGATMFHVKSLLGSTEEPGDLLDWLPPEPGEKWMVRATYDHAGDDIYLVAFFDKNKRLTRTVPDQTYP